MSRITLQRSHYLSMPCHGIKVYSNIQRIVSKMMPSGSSVTRKGNELSKELQTDFNPQVEKRTPSNLRFDSLQPSELIIQENRIEFRQFVARPAQLDEEYWTSAWLRAESHWEDRGNERLSRDTQANNLLQEFDAIKKRCRTQLGEKCTCIVTVTKENKNVKRTVIKSVVGTLDLSIRHLSDSENFPGEQPKAPPFCLLDRKASKRYGYIANLCVAKTARRKGIASNMLYLAIMSAKTYGAEKVFVHVHRHNVPAQRLYEKMGFEVVDEASFQLSAEQTYLLQFQL